MPSDVLLKTFSYMLYSEKIYDAWIIKNAKILISYKIIHKYYVRYGFQVNDNKMIIGESVCTRNNEASSVTRIGNISKRVAEII